MSTIPRRECLLKLQYSPLRCCQRHGLTECGQIGEGAHIEPAALDDEGVTEMAEMGDWPAEAGQAELEEDAEDLEGEPGCLYKSEGTVWSGYPGIWFPIDWARGRGFRRVAAVFRRVSTRVRRPKVIGQ